MMLRQWVITTIAVLVTAQIVSGIRYDTSAGLIAASLLLGILNAFLRPVLLLLSLPLVVFSLGLFLIVINAVLLYLVGQVVSTFHVDSFSSAFWGALLISIITVIANALTGGAQIRGKAPSTPSRPERPQPPPGSGPIIDV